MNARLHVSANLDLKIRQLSHDIDLQNRQLEARCSIWQQFILRIGNGVV